MEDQHGPPADLWAIVEVMGHSKYAGRVSEYAGLGVPLVRVEIPAVGGQAACERLLGAGAIFRITPVTERVAREAARSIAERPLACADFPPLPKWLPGCEPVEDDGDDYEPH